MGAWHRCTHQMAYYETITLWNDDSWILFHTILYKGSAIICGVFLGVYTGLPSCTKSGSTRSVNPWDLHQTSTACDHNGPMSINYDSARNYWEQFDWYCYKAKLLFKALQIPIVYVYVYIFPKSMSKSKYELAFNCFGQYSLERKSHTKWLAAVDGFR